MYITSQCTCILGTHPCTHTLFLTHTPPHTPPHTLSQTHCMYSYLRWDGIRWHPLRDTFLSYSEGGNGGHVWTQGRSRRLGVCGRYLPLCVCVCVCVLCVCVCVLCVCVCVLCVCVCVLCVCQFCMNPTT